jgi:hypothetical protein
MTFIDTSSISDVVQTVLFKPQRMIQAQVTPPLVLPKPIIADVTVEEDMRDELQITDHPVEGTGSGTTFISDHAFKRPVEVVIRMGFTNSQISSLLSGGIISDINSISANGISANNSVAQYNRLLQLQNNRQLCRIVTGKRTYDSMLLQSLSVITDVRSETSLIATARFRQVILVTTRIFQIQTSDQYTAPITPVGSQQLAPFPGINTEAYNANIGAVS